MTLDQVITMIVVATLELVSWMDVRDCIVRGAVTVNASMIRQNVTLNPRVIQDVQSRQARARRRVDQEAVLEVEVIPHLISAIDLATVAKLSLFSPDSSPICNFNLTGFLSLTINLYDNQAYTASSSCKRL